MERVFKLIFFIQVLIIFASQAVAKDADKYGRPNLEILTHFEADDRVIESVFLNEIKQVANEQMFYQVNESRYDMDDSFNVSIGLCQRMSARTVTRLGNHKMATIDDIKTYSSLSRVPFVTTGIAMNTSGQDLEYTVYLRPLYAKALVDLLKHFRWTEFIYICNSNEGLERWQQLIDCFATDGFPVKSSLHFVRNASDALSRLQLLDQRKQDARAKHILLDLNANECNYILREQYNRKTGLHHDYVIVNLIDLDPDFMTRIGINVFAFGLINSDEHSVKQFRSSYTDIDQNISRIFSYAALAVDAVQAVTRGLKNALNRAPVIRNYTLQSGIDIGDADCFNDSIQPFPYGRQVLEAIKEVEFEGLSGKVKFDKFGLRCDYRLLLFRSSEFNRLSQIGHWHPKSGLRIDNVGLTDWTTDRPVVITSILSQPFLMRKNGQNLTGNDRFEGYLVDLIKQVSEIVRFSYTISMVKDGRYGSKDIDTGEWNGMIGEILRNEADLAVAPITITSERERVVDFAGPFMTFGISVMMKRSALDGQRSLSFLGFFSVELWVCILFAYIGTSAVHFIVTRLSGYEVQDDENERVSWRKDFVADSICFCFTRPTPRSTSRPQQKKRPKSLSVRIVVCSWHLLILVLICFYTATMINVLIKQRNLKTINALEDLASQTRVKYGTLVGGSTYEFFRRSTFLTYESMWLTMQASEPSVFVKTIEEGVARVRQEDSYAFILESPSIEYISGHPPCDTVKVGQNLDFKGYGFVTRQGSALRDRLDLALKELNENQELSRLKYKWFDSGQCGHIPQPRSKIHEKFSIFYALICAIGLALIIFGCEHLKETWKKKRQEKDANTSDVRPQNLELEDKGPSVLESKTTDQPSLQCP